MFDRLISQGHSVSNPLCFGKCVSNRLSISSFPEISPKKEPPLVSRRTFWIYILGSESTGKTYVGQTSDLTRRGGSGKQKAVSDHVWCGFFRSEG